MKDQKTSIEIGIYYDKINELVDKYINDWNIKPSKLYNYLKPGNKRFDTFVEKSGLSDFKFIKKVITDVLEDRLSMEQDGIMIYESVLSAIEPSSVDHEKVLADLYNTSLGHVTMVDVDKHIYEVSSFGDITKVIIYSNDEIDKIKNNIQEDFMSKISDKKITIDSIGVVFKLSDIIANDKLMKEFGEKMNYENLMEYILKFFKSDLQNNELKYKTYKNYHIWEL